MHCDLDSLHYLNTSRSDTTQLSWSHSRNTLTPSFATHDLSPTPSPGFLTSVSLTLNTARLLSLRSPFLSRKLSLAEPSEMESSWNTFPNAISANAVLGRVGERLSRGDVIVAVVEFSLSESPDVSDDRCQSLDLKTRNAYSPSDSIEHDLTGELRQP
jgi:hypothetical protein